MLNERVNFYYDPAREGYDTTLWKTVTGVPSVVSNKIRLNTAKIVGYADIFKGEVTYKLAVPAVPTNATLVSGNAATSNPVTWAAVSDGEFAITIDGTARDITGLDFSSVTTMAEVAAVIQAGIRSVTGSTETCTWTVATSIFTITSTTSITVASAVAAGAGTDISGVGATAFLDAETGRGTATQGSDREFGLEQLGGSSKLTFKIAGDTLTCEALYEGVSSSTSVDWDTAWTAVATDFTIKWTGFSAEFLIGGVQKVFLTDTDVLSVPTVKIPKKALSQMISNASADNMDITIINVNNVQGYI